jgi:hypothetical protein
LTAAGRRARVDRVAVADRHTGAVWATLPIPPRPYLDERPLDVAADGRLVVADEGRLLTVAPGAPPATLPGRGRSAPRWSGGRIAALASDRLAVRPVLIDPAGGPVQRLGAPSGVLERIAADERGAVWLANGCVRYAAVAGPPPSGPPEDPCPAAEVTLLENTSLLRGRTVRARLQCVTAPGGVCRGTAIVRRVRRVGTGHFRIPAGATRRVDVRLTPRGRRHVRRALLRAGTAWLSLDARVDDGRVGGGRGATDVVVTGVARAPGRR